MKHKFVYVANTKVNIDQIVLVKYKLEEITPELSQGDIFNVFVSFHLADGSILKSTDHIAARRMVLAVTDDALYAHTKDDDPLAYYVFKMNVYYNAVEENKNNATCDD